MSADRVEGARPGWVAKFLYREFRKRLGLVPKSKTLAAHHTPTLLATTWMDAIGGKPRTVSSKLMELGQLKAAALVGCPF